MLNLLRREPEFLINEIKNGYQHRHVHRYVDAGYRDGTAPAVTKARCVTNFLYERYSRGLPAHPEVFPSILSLQVNPSV